MVVEASGSSAESLHQVWHHDVIMAFDIKRAPDARGPLIAEPLLFNVLYEELLTACGKQPDELDEQGRPLSQTTDPESLREIFADWSGSYAYVQIRLPTDHLNLTFLHALLAWNHVYDYPELVFIHGTLVNFVNENA